MGRQCVHPLSDGCSVAALMRQEESPLVDYLSGLEAD